jgi:hypothetical protein
MKTKGDSAMSMNVAENRGTKCEINVTPMIDVLLVLLIIFMVIVPAIPRGEQPWFRRPPLARNRGTTRWSSRFSRAPPAM